MQTPGWHNTGACLYYVITDTTAHTLTGATTLVGFVNLSASAQTNAVQAWDGQNVSGQPLTPPVTAAAAPNGIYMLPLGGVQSQTGFITVKAAGAITTGVMVLYQVTSIVGPGVGSGLGIYG